MAEGAVGNDTIGELTRPEALRAAARSTAYRLFAGGIGYPEGRLLESVRSGELAEAITEALGAIDPKLLEGFDADALRDAGADDDLPVEYTRLFDVGASGPPCPLYGGLYGGARMKVMEEAVRFYNHFGLKLSESPRELPDHLTTELEFLHYLAYREAEAIEAGEDAGPYQRAQRDFIERHPGKWVPMLVQRLEGQKPMRFFRALFGGLERLLSAAHSELNALEH
jgi:DMSO reductase family type II enzyme chaperone